MNMFEAQVSLQILQSQPDVASVTLQNARLGDFCGAIFLDDRFEKFMNVHVDWYNMDSYNRQEVMMSYWEHGKKRNFRPDLRRKRSWHVHADGKRLVFNE